MTLKEDLKAAHKIVTDKYKKKDYEYLWWD